ncbi:MAG: nrdG [Firmicutes bacterium]|nr:nrdG [Bacillota bacterium]
MKLKIAGTVKESVVDGPGIRFVIFTQGCPHNCVGCHNPKTHDPAQGTVTTTEALLAEIANAKLIRGITFSGGEPFLQPEPLTIIAEQTKAFNLNIVTYSGYTFEKLLVMAASDKAVERLLKHTDLLVDGPYLEAERDISLAFRGSRNQRLVDVKKSLVSGHAVLWSPTETDNGI